MDLAVILTYRCDSRCSMCNIWQHPTDPTYEVSLDDLAKLPSGFDYLNLSGGEPTLRSDLGELCDLLRPKAMKLEISTNGLHVDRIVPIVKKYPDLKVRISVDGIGELNNMIRGERGGYDRKVDSMKKLIDAGGCDLGFAMTFQDENVDQVVDLYRLSRSLGVEFATSAIHNGFQFHKNDNYVYNRLAVARKAENLVTEMLRSWSIKGWFRAYLNLGLIAKILGHDRLMPCTAATDFIFVDPWADVYACNVRNDLLVGNIRKQTWPDIMGSEELRRVRDQVARCTQNCWMVASAKTAMRNKHFAKLPKVGVLSWVVLNKLKVMAGLPVNFDRYVDYSTIHEDPRIVQRTSYLENPPKRKVQPAESLHYTQFDGFDNR